MVQITTRVSESVAKALDDVASRQGISRSDLVRQTIEQSAEDLDDILTVLQRLQNPLDPVEDWDEVRRALLARTYG